MDLRTYLKRARISGRAFAKLINPDCPGGYRQIYYIARGQRSASKTLAKRIELATGRQVRAYEIMKGKK